jgi:CHAD domain-containing protein
MTYQLERDEAVSAGVRRMTVEQIDAALDWLGRPPEQIHDAVHAVRQSSKRVRALLELVRDGIGDEAYRREHACFRDVARRLGGARDAAVLVETLEGLARRFSGQLTRSAFERVRRSLASSRDARIRRLLDEEQILWKTSEILASARDRISSWPDDEDGFGPVRRGIKRSYREGQEGLRTVERDPSPANFHDWRKPAKTLYHQLQVIAPMWPGLMTALAHELHDLSDRLNENHDLAVLRQRLLAPDAAVKTRDREALVALADERCAELQAEAVPLGALLYAETPSEFADRLGCYWRTWKPVKRARARASA